MNATNYIFESLIDVVNTPTGEYLPYELDKIAEDKQLDYHRMLLGLHGDCEELDVMKAISARTDLVNKLSKFKPKELTYKEYQNKLTAAINKTCYAYAAHVSNLMSKEPQNDNTNPSKHSTG